MTIKNRHIVSSLILVFIPLFTSKTVSQWCRQDTSNHDGLYKVFFIDSTNGYAGGNGFILKTVDGGSNWERKVVLGGAEQLYFLDRSIGFYASSGYPYTHILYRTTDGGDNWQSVDAGSCTLYSISFIDSLVGLAVGTNNVEQSIILKTTDGGKLWSSSYYGSSGAAAFRAVTMLSRQVAFIGGGGPEKIWKTTDGGNNWQVAFSASDIIYDTPIRSIVFPDTLHGYAIGSHFYKTSDGGTSWSSVDIPALYHIAVSSIANESWLISQGRSFPVLYSSDYGGTWTPVLKICGQRYMNDMFFINGHIGWIVGADGFLLKTTNGGFSSIPLPIQPRVFTPSNDTLLVRLPVTFQWTFDTFSFHRFQISQDSLFNSTMSDQLSLDSMLQVNNLQSYTRYFWRVRSENILGNSSWSSTSSLQIGKLVAGVDGTKHLVREQRLSQIYPNPFNPSTTVDFQLPLEGFVTINIFDALGREVAPLLSKQLPQGDHKVIWNAEHYPSGMYFCRFQYRFNVETSKLLLLR